VCYPSWVDRDLTQRLEAVNCHGQTLRSGYTSQEKDAEIEMHDADSQAGGCECILALLEHENFYNAQHAFRAAAIALRLIKETA
jgi:hypothetical protein